MSVHQALWRDGRPTFAGQGYADLSQLCLQFIAGMMAHARALNAFTNPTTNSYKRLRPGQDEPTLIAYAAHNRSAAIRIPYAAQPEDKRVEVRFPDPMRQPLSRLHRDPDGRARRHRAQARARRRHGPQPLRPAPRGGRGPGLGQPLARRGAGRAGGRPRVPDPRRRACRPTWSRPMSRSSGASATWSSAPRTRSSSSSIWGCDG